MNLSDSTTAGQSGRLRPQARPLARVSAQEAVLAQLRGDIEGGRIAVGSKLPSEAALAGTYGVSRSVIREALRSCAALGLTETRTGKGTFVIADRVSSDLVLGRYSARDLTEARPHIEVPAAALAAERHSAEDLDLLRSILTDMLAEDDVEAWVALDSAFHLQVARASRNKVFESVVSDLREALVKQSSTLNLVADREGTSNREHREILEAIESGSPERAARAMADHLAAVSAALSSLENR
ncbi:MULTISPECIES: FadR/GntR family transcriptional regulator [Arthrobacter]|uniref:FadR/GntR family transcriptional regulator n=2 Tax=Arthrobacter TaxID=1663 RepID=A0ABU9KMQ1_9MICC|nr:FadR/GntR family transcriptional regulator [Arthrobacter sp. YJM1]MDP5227384.1 FadR/GntR family transcriptional regulator [Arthrobacter sp. YJM1]